MSVTRISRLRGCGVFRDFLWPADMLGFGRYNLVYGWNWSGKTTLSRVFRDLELRRPPAVGEATLRIEERDVSSNDFPGSTLQVRVFNKDFISESVFPVGGSDVPPIFVVGRESVEKQKVTDQLKTQREEKEGELNSACVSKLQAERGLDRHCVERAGVIRDMLRLTGSAYNNYDKRDYRQRAEKMAADGDAASHRLSESERESLLAQHHAAPKPKVSEIAYKLPRLQDVAGDVAALLGMTVASAGLETLKEDTTLAEWIRRGLGLHKERKSDKCLFCEQPFPADRLVALETHFSAEYERFLRRIDERAQLLESVRTQAAEVRTPDRAALYEDLAKEYDSANHALRQVLDLLQAFLADAIEALNDKKAQPFKASVLTVSIPEIDTAVVERLNEVIRRHNHACDDFERRANGARDRLALAIIAENLDEFVRLQNAAQTAMGAIGPIQADMARLSDQITTLERDIREHQQPAEELNEDLKKYLGHGELQLAIKETGYAITRNGVPADLLSEGEMTAIALLYFLKSLEDRGFDKAKGVVVLDDPVSSLDSNALYLAFGFIKERTKSVAQLIILTHNFAFFRQVRNWFRNLPKQRSPDSSRRPARFYMLECCWAAATRSSVIRPLDPMLVEFDSEYHYLFASVYRRAQAADGGGLEENYAFPNMARRLLEAFLAFRQPARAGMLKDKLEATGFDEAKTARIIRFLHTHSHGDVLSEPAHDPSVLSETGAVLRNLLEFMEAQDKDHYTAMAELVALPAEAEGTH